MAYICVECSKVYQYDECPTDRICKSPDCPGDGIAGYLVVLPQNQVVEPPLREPIFPIPLSRDVGLAVLVMDASGSMQDDAFPGSGNPVNRKIVVAGAVAQAIFSLQQMHQSDRAYVAIIMFDTRQELLMTYSIKQYIEKFGEAKALKEHLIQEYDRFNGGTDIAGALNMAKAIVQEFKAGKMTALGDYRVLSHAQYSPFMNKSLDVPNIRVLVYTDGEHNADVGLSNPFNKEEPDLLMGVYFGPQQDKGREELEKILGNCPVHNQKQFFVFDAPEKVPQLKGFFRMASGASGFCPTCLAPVETRKSEIRSNVDHSKR